MRGNRRSALKFEFGAPRGGASTSTFAKKMAVRFINVDLDIESTKSLDYVCLELSRSGIHHLHCGPSGRGFFARLECAEGGDTCEADSVICKFCDAIESLDERASNEWKAAYRRCFDLGYETSGSDLCWQSDLQHQTLSRVVALGASIAFTVYPRDQSEQDETGQPPLAALSATSHIISTSTPASTPAPASGGASS